VAFINCVVDIVQHFYVWLGKVLKKNSDLGKYMPEINDQYRRDLIEKSLNDYIERKATKSLTIEYLGEERTFPVIRIDPKVLLLNHNNNRLSAQLHDHNQKETVYGNPASENAQLILADLLSKTASFKDLKDELSQIGQQNPGLITRNGLLVNGNTRVVALRLLGKAGVDVAVLPDGADDNAILDLEMFLQMVHLTHQDYTFTNELLLLDKCKKLGNTDKQIADKMKWSRGWQKKLNEKFQLLRLINEIINLSPKPLAYEVFDSKSQHLKDLNEEYESLKVNDLAAANRMKWSRVAAMFLNVNKDQTRAIDEDFVDEDILKQIDPDSPSSKLLDGLTKVYVDDGLGEILGDKNDTSEKVDAKALAKAVISSRIDESGFISALELSPEFSDLRKKIILSSEAIITKHKRKTILTTPADELRTIRESLENVVNLFHEVSGQPDFDSIKFKYELSKASTSLNDLVSKFEKFSK